MNGTMEYPKTNSPMQRNFDCLRHPTAVLLKSITITITIATVRSRTPLYPITNAVYIGFNSVSVIETFFATNETFRRSTNETFRRTVEKFPVSRHPMGMHCPPTLAVRGGHSVGGCPVVQKTVFRSDGLKSVNKITPELLNYLLVPTAAFCNELVYIM